MQLQTSLNELPKSIIKDMNQSKTNEHQSIIDSHINNPNQYTIHH